MKRILFLSLLFLGMMPSLAQAQSRKLQRADQLFEKLAYLDAVDLYAELARSGEAKEHVSKRLAECYRMTDQTEQAEYWYGIVIESQNYLPEDAYYFAQALRSNGRFESSAYWMNEFAKMQGGDSRAQREVEQQSRANVMIADSNSVVLQNLSINTKNSDFGAMYYRNKVVFATSRDEGGAVKQVYVWNNQPFLDMYVAERNATGELSNATAFSPELNTRYHEGPATFNASGNVIYFTRNNLQQQRLVQTQDGENRLKIYTANLVGDIWGGVEELPFNGDDFSTGHPSLSYDGKWLYFASDRPGGYGGTDIYRVTKNTGLWSQPENLGPVINTEGNEMFPFIHPDGTLYFSSDGLVGFGGLDIFMALADSNSFKIVVNMGYPLNSTKDDFSFISDEYGQTGYISSNREDGKGDDDIYLFKFKDANWLVSTTDFARNPNNPNNPRNPNNPGNPGGGTTGTGGSVGTGNPAQPGDPDGPNDYYTEVITTPLDELPDDFVFKPGQVILLKNIYYDLDKDNIRPDAAADLNKVIQVMRQYPTMRIELSSHTDCRAPNDYNEDLSQRRAFSAMQYIVFKGGIDISRITGKGYGERRLTNGCADGIDCDEGQHQANRRTEIMIVEL